MKLNYLPELIAVALVKRYNLASDSKIGLINVVVLEKIINYLLFSKKDIYATFTQPDISSENKGLTKAQIYCLLERLNKIEKLEIEKFQHGRREFCRYRILLGSNELEEILTERGLDPKELLASMNP